MRSSSVSLVAGLLMVVAVALQVHTVAAGPCATHSRIACLAPHTLTDHCTACVLSLHQTAPNAMACAPTAAAGAMAAPAVAAVTSATTLAALLAFVAFWKCASASVNLHQPVSRSKTKQHARRSQYSEMAQWRPLLTCSLVCARYLRHLFGYRHHHRNHCWLRGGRRRMHRECQQANMTKSCDCHCAIGSRSLPHVWCCCWPSAAAATSAAATSKSSWCKDSIHKRLPWDSRRSTMLKGTPRNRDTRSRLITRSSSSSSNTRVPMHTSSSGRLSPLR